MKNEVDKRVYEYARRNNWLLDGELSQTYLRTCILEYANLKYVPKYVLKAVDIDGNGREK